MPYKAYLQQFLLNIEFYSMEVHIKIRQIREAQGIKQQSLADILGITQQNYARIETGKVSITMERLEKISEVFGMTVLEILTYQDTPSNTLPDASLVVRESQAVQQLQQNYINLLQKVSDLQDMTTRFSLLLEHSQAKIVASQHEIEMLHETIQRAFRYIYSLEAFTKQEQAHLAKDLEEKMVLVLQKVRSTEKKEIKKELAYEKMIEMLKEKTFNFQQLSTGLE